MPSRPRSFELEPCEVMSRNGVGSSVPFWYTRTTPPFSVINIRPSGAKAMPVANGRLLATTSSTKPDGVKVMIASEGPGFPRTASPASRDRVKLRNRLERPRRTDQRESDFTLITAAFPFIHQRLARAPETPPLDRPCRLPVSDPIRDGPNAVSGSPGLVTGGCSLPE